MSRPRPTIADDELLAVEKLSKRVTDVHAARYMPTVSLVARLRARWEGAALSGGGGFGGDDTDADDDDDDDEEDEEEQGFFGSEGALALRDISFTVRGGEALGVVGERSSVDLLARILGRMTDPTSGSFVYRGRLGLSYGLAMALAGDVNSSPPRVLRLLAGLAGVPRSGRRGWVGEGIALVGGGEPSARWHLGEKALRRRLAVAASLDPAAQVLVIERLPDHADADFRARCLRRLRDRLEAGAAAILLCSDLDAIAHLCTRVACLEDGEVAAIGLNAPVLERFRNSLRNEQRAAYAETPGFNATVAIHDVAVAHAPGGERLVVRVELETAKPETEICCSARLRGQNVLSLAQDEPTRLEAPGLYVTTLEADARALEPGEYLLSVEVVASDRDGQRSVAVRSSRRPLRIAAEGEPGTATLEGEMANELPLLDWSVVSEPEFERP